MASPISTNEKPSLRTRTSVSTSNGQDGGAAGTSALKNAPPYWNAHQRTVSNISYCSVANQFRRPGITLEDHTEGPAEEAAVVWANGVTVDDWVVVGAKGLGEWGPGSYVVWNCTLEMIEGGHMKIRKRYSQFDELRHHLVQTFPKSEESIPPLPPKSMISKFGKRFLEKRQMGLSYFLHCVILNPEFAGSPILKEFLFS